jgi:hypothetical protein
MSQSQQIARRFTAAVNGMQQYHMATSTMYLRDMSTSTFYPAPPSPPSCFEPDIYEEPEVPQQVPSIKSREVVSQFDGTGAVGWL